MTAAEKKIEIARLQEEANVAKERLSRISNELYHIGAIRQAKSLETIMARLEIWQNS